MARSRNADRLTRKRREISVADADWKAVKAEANAADLSMSRYLIERRGTAPAPAPAKIPPETIARYLETSLDIRDRMSVLAQGICGTETACGPAILLELIAIERRLATLTEAAVRK